MGATLWLRGPGSSSRAQQVWCKASVAPWRVGSSPSGTEPATSVLAGGFLTTGPPGLSFISHGYLIHGVLRLAES